MSAPIYDIDEKLWEEYLSYCRAESEFLGAPIHPDYKSFLIWKEDQDIDDSEAYSMEPNDDL